MRGQWDPTEVNRLLPVGPEGPGPGLAPQPSVPAPTVIALDVGHFKHDTHSPARSLQQTKVQMVGHQGRRAGGLAGRQQDIQLWGTRQHRNSKPMQKQL